MEIGGVTSNQYTADMWGKKAYPKTSSNQSVQNQFMRQMDAACGGRPGGYQVYMKTDDMLYSGGNGSGLSFYMKYAEGSTEEDPTVVAKGVDEYGKEFEQTIHVNDINPRSATVVEMHALEAYLGVDKNGGLSSLPKDPSLGNMGLRDRADFIDMFRKSIRDMNTLGQRKLSAYYEYSMQTYWDFMEEREKKAPVSTDFNAPFGYWKKNLREAPEKKSAAQKSKTDTEIITQADGTRMLMITTHIGETETLMSVKLSEPSAFQNDYVKSVKKEMKQRAENTETKSTGTENTETKSTGTENTETKSAGTERTETKSTGTDSTEMKSMETDKNSSGN